MSRYEDYTAVARDYDGTRVAIGVDILRDFLSAAPVPLRDARLLDAGCGSGAYAEAMLPHVRHIDAVDLNDGMLSMARAKLEHEEAAGRIAFHCAGIETLPFDSGTFDAAMINQVLHHLEDGTDGAWPAHAAVMAEMHRVLRPGGVLVVNMCTHTQLRNGYWYYELVPEARAACIRRHIPTANFREMLDKAGFAFHGSEVPHDAVMQGGAYFDAAGPLREAWRKGDSFWALATAEQIARAEARIRDMQAAGTLEAWFRERDARRVGVGQFTFFAAVRA